MNNKNYERGGHFLDTITYKRTALSINRTSQNYSVQTTYIWTLHKKPPYTFYKKRYNIVINIMAIKLEEELKKLLDSAELDLIESKANKFNIFRTLKLSNQELKHSRFLAWLLNPNETHSLRDYPLKEFLKSLSLFDNRTISIFDIDGWNLSETDIFIELKNIDLLIVNHSYKFVYVIENKIWTTNHDKQLTRYKEIIDKKYPNYQKNFLYLTPMGDRPRDDDAADEYICISYTNHIYPLVQKILSRFDGSLGSDVLMFIKHYQTMIEEDIMDNKKLKEVCMKIYRNHKNALDLIFENKPDLQFLISEVLQQIVKEQGFKLDSYSKTYVRFYPTQFEKYKFLRKGNGWTNTNNILLFEFKNTDNRLTCNLIIGPSDKNEIREAIYQIAQQHGADKNTLTRKWTTIYHHKFKVDNLFIEEEDKIYPELSSQFISYKPEIEKITNDLCKGLDKLSSKNF